MFQDQQQPLQVEQLNAYVQGVFSFSVLLDLTSDASKCFP